MTILRGELDWPQYPAHNRDEAGSIPAPATSSPLQGLSATLGRPEGVSLNSQ